MTFSVRITSYLRQGAGYAIKSVCLSLCLSVCLSVCLCARLLQKYIVSRFHWNLVLWLGLPIGRTD